MISRNLGDDEATVCAHAACLREVETTSKLTEPQFSCVQNEVLVVVVLVLILS